MSVTPKILAERVAIAKDVLAQLADTERPLKATRGCYIDGYIPLPAHSCDVKDVVDQIQANCKMCAKGALLMSYARLLDNVRLSEIGSPSVCDNEAFAVYASNTTIMEVLSPVFGRRFLNKIERVFEHGHVSDPKVTLGQLMRDIVSNGGASHYDDFDE